MRTHTAKPFTFKGLSSVQLPQVMLGPLRALGKQLEPFDARGASWETWTACAPLVPDIKDQGYLQPLEKAILQRLGHLQEVCLHPRDQLRREEERVPVSRAHRVPSRAFETLAAHPEDWLRRTLRGVAPKRVVALISEEELDLYENRVAARLVDHLRHYLRLRLQQLEKIRLLMEQANDLSERMSDAHWGAALRTSQLLGDLFEDHQGLKALKRTREQLEQLDLTLHQLETSRLYRHVPRQATVSVALRPTNILISDQHYRHIALLWRTWVRFGRLTRTPAQLAADQRHWQCFCRLAVMRALELLKLEPIALPGTQLDALSVPLPNPLRVIGKLGTLTLTVHPDGTLQLEAEDVASPLWLWTEVPEEAARVKRRGDHRFLVAADGHSEGERIPVSPLDLYSVERVMGAIQFWLLARRFEAYPVQVEPPDALKQVAGSLLEPLRKAEWLRVKEEGQGTRRRWWLELQSPPKENGRSVPILLESLTSQRLEGRPGVTASTRAHETPIPWRTLEAPLQQGLARLQRLRICPVCQAEASAKRFQARGDTFACTCESCESRWETRRCSHCQKIFAVLRRKGDPVERRATEQKSLQPSKDWLALPDPEGDDRWQCYHCGE